MKEPISLQNIIKNAIEQRLLDLHTMLPGKVVSYDSATQTADVQPQIKKTFNNGQSAVNLPVIPEVPVWFFRTVNSHIHIPLKADDYVMLIVAERSLDKFMLSDGIVDPQDSRKHNLSDCVAIPGLFPTSKKFTVTNPDDIEIVNSNGRISIKPNGKFQVTNGTNELVSMMYDLCTYCEAITTATMMGIQPVLNKAMFTALKSKIESLKG